jgi:hypothetical protein
MPSVDPDLFASGIGCRAPGESVVNSAVMREFSSRALCEETLAIRLVYVMKGLVGALPILGVHSFVDVANDLLVSLHEVKVFARFVFPGIAVVFGKQGKAWGCEK